MTDSSFPTIVSGLGRCGSSMVMQMLVVGGLDITGDACWPMCEDQRATWLPKKTAWLHELGGRDVVKILNPSEFELPRWFDCRAIWLERDREEQTKSWIKYGEKLRRYKPNAKRLTENQIRQMMESRSKRGARIMKERARGKFLVLKFEEILEDPYKSALAMEELIGDLDTCKMAQAVAPRGPQCLEGFLEEGNAEQGALG